jgi:hypothetical protein
MSGLTFAKRLRLFMVGVVIGSVIVYFMVLKDRDIYKTPEQIILTNLTEKPGRLNERPSCLLKCLNADEQVLKEWYKSASVYYSESDVRRLPAPIYKIYLKENPYKIEAIRVELSRDSSLLLDIYSTAITADCNCPN